jgi:hypothetical protein
MNAPSTNPFNDQPTVRLLDQAGVELSLVSQRDAAKLLRAGHADLVFEVPPAIRLNILTSDYAAFLAAPPDDEAVKALFLHARRSVLYGNVHFQSPRGETMFHADNEKALWYLNRGLVEVVSQSPPVLRFQFIPGGPGHAGDEYYLTGKANHCVVCGATDGLNRHHVVPSVYRRHLPAAVKDHSHHDVLLLCLGCHEKYEAAADLLKAELGEEHGVPLHGLRGHRDETRNRAVKAAIALVRHGATIPAARKDELLGRIRAWTGQSTPSDADIESVAALAMTPDGQRIEHGQHVIAQTPDIQAFIRRWRQHFLCTMQPRYLPAYWDIDRPAVRERGEGA